MNVHYLQHVAHEGPGYIEEWAKQRNHRLTVTKLFERQSFPEMSDFDFLVVMGGPMSVLDDNKFKWLEDEKSFIIHAIAEGKKVLGICLGAQLIAYLLGAEINKSPFTEIGWFPVSKITNHFLFNNIPDEFMAFHWHGEMFEIPPGAERIFESKGCSNQGFVYYDKVVGFQFHIETTPENLNSMLDSENIDDFKGEYIQTSIEVKSKSGNTEIINAYLADFLDKLAQS